MGTTTVKLTPDALAFYEGHALRRARLQAKIEALLDEQDQAEEEMFVVLSEMLGLDLECAWEVIDRHYAEFGVVLVRQLAGREEDEDDARDQDPEGVARG